MANLAKGSSGDDVKALQEKLIAAGYDVGSTGADGKYGANTEAAVIQYQKDNPGLTVDGIAGVQTQSSLGMSNVYNPDGSLRVEGSPTPSTTSNDSWKYTTGPGANGYWENGGVDYYDYGLTGSNTNSNYNKSVDPYESAYKDEIDTILQSILKQGTFQGTDDSTYKTMYANAEKQYTANAQKAMQNAIANASALTGGYGSSYATSAGQQAYNDYMLGLNDVSNQLLQLAYNQYQDSLSNQYNQLAALRGLDSDAYSQWQTNNNMDISQATYNDTYEKDILDEATAMAASGITPTIYSKYLDDDTMEELTNIATEAKKSATSGTSSKTSSKAVKADGTAWKKSDSTDDDPEAGVKYNASIDYLSNAKVTNKTKTDSATGEELVYVDQYGWINWSTLKGLVADGKVKEKVSNNNYTYSV